MSLALHNGDLMVKGPHDRFFRKIWPGPAEQPLHEVQCFFVHPGQPW